MLLPLFLAVSAVALLSNGQLVTAPSPLFTNTNLSCASACSQWSPCCATAGGTQGYCFNQPWACMTSEGCIPDSTFGKKCTPVPMCKSFREEFNDPKVLIDRYNYTNPDGAAKVWRQNPGADNAEIVDGNLVLTLKWNDKEGKGAGATIPTLRFFQYGVISARIKVAGGQGVISSFITKTSTNDNVGDEIDFEMLGAHPNEVQTNFYWNGNIDYTKGARYNFPEKAASTIDDYHIYTIDWNADRMIWLVDGSAIRTVTADSVKGKYPSQISRIYFSVWDAGCGTLQGTVDWAGGATDWCADASKRGQTRKMYVDWLDVKCASEDAADPKSYVAAIVSPTTGGGSGGSGGGVGAGNTELRTPTAGGGKGGNAGDAIGGGSALSPALGLGAAAAVMALL
ncbi:concanavalin A-like lectin/glucanase domain-containing protein [Blastocladiella britannica]|nr:concanavalin A-like lectin/glucanase domain-containing protein [Blastocladiella britannica]